jgi:hypothetical protein
MGLAVFSLQVFRGQVAIVWHHGFVVPIAEQWTTEFRAIDSWSRT